MINNYIKKLENFSDIIEDVHDTYYYDLQGKLTEIFDKYKKLKATGYAKTITKRIFNIADKIDNLFMDLENEKEELNNCISDEE